TPLLIQFSSMVSHLLMLSVSLTHTHTDTFTHIYTSLIPQCVCFVALPLHISETMLICSMQALTHADPCQTHTRSYTHTDRHVHTHTHPLMHRNANTVQTHT